jgi:nitroreductase
VLRRPDGLAALGIADTAERFVGLVYLGYPRQEKGAPERAPLDDVVIRLP